MQFKSFDSHLTFRAFLQIIVQPKYHIGQSCPVARSDERHIERGLEGGLVPTGERSARVGRLELRRGCVPRTPIRMRVLCPIEASHIVAQYARVIDGHFVEAAALFTRYYTYE